ncbi:coat protein [Abeliophyllum distichum]|uniref:Coat protein n=1 Tax=Abeliophyllum distichum TaxID=126358 RepID=A0ABD1Q769_9LAMI
MKGVEIGRLKVEVTELPLDYQNPKGDGKRPVGDNNPRPIPDDDSDPNHSTHFTPKRTNHSITILDIDCTLDPNKVIDNWYNNIMIAIIVNKEIIRSELNSWNYVLASTRGNAIAYLENFDYTVKNEIWKDSYPSIPNFVKRIVEQLYKQFTGQTYEVFKSGRITINVADALNHLEKISICDMCNFENYCCKFSKYFYICPPISWTSLVEKLIRKLPEPFNHDVTDMFNSVVKLQGTSGDPRINAQTDASLGLAISLARDLADKCKESYLVKSSKRAVAKNPIICYDKYLDSILGQYGCYPKRKQTKRCKKKSYKFKKYKKPYKKKYFKRKKFFKKSTKDKNDTKEKSDTKKFCPQNKKNCRCWLCNKTCYYANECQARLEMKTG